MKNRLLLAAALALSSAAAFASTITILVQKTALRKRPQSYAPSIGTAKLGQKFESSGLESGFYKTSAGYIHSSAVTERKVRLGSDESVGGSVNAQEVTLAGKGFNPQVEKAYREQNGSLDFSKVDEMAGREAGEAELFAFLREGGLLSEGGSK